MILMREESARKLTCPFNTQAKLIAVALAATQWFLPIIHVVITPSQNIIYSAFMTVVSVARSYVVRRMFNSEFWKRWKKPAPCTVLENQRNLLLAREALARAISDDIERRVYQPESHNPIFTNPPPRKP